MMVVMSVTEITILPSSQDCCSGRRRRRGGGVVSCHTIWYLMVVGGVRAVSDWVWRVEVAMIEVFLRGDLDGKNEKGLGGAFYEGEGNVFDRIKE